jgi:hypothetical protein
MIKRKPQEKIINEQALNEYNQLQSDNSRLVVKWKNLLLAENAPRLNKEELGTVAKLLENQQTWVEQQYAEMGKNLQESYVSTTGGVEPFLKILVPTVRRSYKSMSALDLVGVQAMNAPQGFAYALRFHYAGDRDKVWSQPGGLDRAYDTETDAPAELEHRSYVLVFPKNSTSGATTNVVYDDITVGNLLLHKTVGGVALADASDFVDTTSVISDFPTYIAGEIVYKEEDKNFVKIMVNRYLNGTTYTTLPIVTDSVYVSDIAYTELGDASETAVTIASQDETVVQQYFWNEIGYRFVLKNFTGRYTTATGELMGVYGAPEGTPEWKTIKMTMERVPVYVKTRKLKLQYSDEMYQDLKAVHGMMVNEELMRIAEFEVANEINADILSRILTASTDAGAWVYGDYVGMALANSGADGVSGRLAVSAMADGRFEKEKFQTLATKIRKEANEIALQTRRGSGNWIVVTPNVLTALQALDFIPASATGGETLISGLSFVGMLQNLKVYVDTYNIFGQDYCTVGYKGTSQYDAGLIYCPYVALQVKKTVDPLSLQDVYGFLVRDAIVSNLYGSALYFRTFTVDLTGSSIS